MKGRSASLRAHPGGSASLRSVGFVALAAIPTAFVALPVVYALVRSAEAGLGPALDELGRPLTRELLLNTLVLSGSVTILSALIGTAAAWLTERTDVPAPGAVRIAVSLPLAVPALVTSYAWASLGPAFQGMGAAIAALTLYSVPLIYLAMVAALRATDPAFEEVARSLGRGPFRAFLEGALPQCLPALGGGALLVASHMLAEFGALSFLQVQTFTTAIFQQYDMQFDTASGALLSGVLLLLCLPVVAAEIALRGRRRFARVGRGAARAVPTVRLGGWTGPALAAVAVYGALAYGVPVATVLSWLREGRSLADGLSHLGPALAGSIGYSLPGGAATTLAAVPLVLLALRTRGSLATMADRAPFVIHGLPGLVVALSLVFVTVRWLPGLYQTPGLVILAYGILFLPVAQSAFRASAELVPPAIEPVARSLGRGPVGAFWAVTVPAVLPGLAASFALVTMQLMREVTATLVLAPPGVTTLATEFWSYTNDRAYAAAAPFGVLLVLLSGVPVFVFGLGMTRRA